jgi:hypothetical protein
MIIGRLTGGLGNQLFQYANARAIGLRTRLPVCLHADAHSGAHRRYRLDAYNLPARRALDEDLDRFLTPLHRYREVCETMGRVNRHLPFRWRRVITEDSLRFDARILTIVRPVYLSGFWQCERYFDDHAETIRHELTLRGPVAECHRTVLSQIDGSESVAVSVRRGDYLGIPNTQGICTVDYYRRALALITARIPHRRVFVFSDDIPWCRTHLDDPGTTFVESGPADEPEQDLRILSHCRHFVLANSTFAWWGAWLSPHADKVVVGPSKWMQDAEPFADVLPARWLRVRVD